MGLTLCIGSVLSSNPTPLSSAAVMYSVACPRSRLPGLRLKSAVSCKGHARSKDLIYYHDRHVAKFKTVQLGNSQCLSQPSSPQKRFEEPNLKSVPRRAELLFQKYGSKCQAYAMNTSSSMAGMHWLRLPKRSQTQSSVSDAKCMSTNTCFKDTGIVEHETHQRVQGLRILWVS